MTREYRLPRIFCATLVVTASCVLPHTVAAQSSNDTCISILRAATSALRTAKPAIAFDDYDNGWSAVRCAAALGSSTNPAALAAVEDVLTIARTSSEYGSEGMYVRRLQESAFRARSELMLAKHQSRELFDRLLREFAISEDSASTHDRDLMEFASFELGDRAELFPLLMAYGRAHFAPPPVGFAASFTVYRDHERFARFERLLAFDTPDKRGELVGLLTDNSADVRALGVELATMSPETTDTLIAVHASSRDGARASLHAALEALRAQYLNVIASYAVNLKSEHEGTPWWNHLKGESDAAKALLGRIDAAMK